MLAGMDTFPDLGSLSDQELKDLIQQLTEEEVDISYKRRILHGKIDILRAELVAAENDLVTGNAEVATARLFRVVEGGRWAKLAYAPEYANAELTLGRALSGHSPGDTIEYHCPEGIHRVELVKIQQPT